MNRPLPILIAAFVALCAVGLWLTRPGEAPREQEPPSRPEPEPTAHKEPSVMPTPPSVPHVDAGTPVPRAAAAIPSPNRPRRGPEMSPDATPLATGAPLGTFTDAGEEEQVDPELARRAVAKLEPLVMQCFDDAADRYPGAQSVVLRFNLRGQAQIQSITVQDPWVQACVMDSVLDAHLEALDGGTATLTHPFRFEGR